MAVPLLRQVEIGESFDSLFGRSNLFLENDKWNSFHWNH